MRIISMTSQKGGAGKTTLVESISVAAAKDGEAVLAIDLDPQGTLAKWRVRRGEPNGVDVLPAAAAEVADIIRNARKSGRYSLVIIDTPGFHGPELGLALQDVELCLVPTRPTLKDLESVMVTAEALKMMNKPFAFVINCAKTNSPARTMEVAHQLVSVGWLAPSFVCDRNDFWDASILGQGVVEFAPDSKAAQEIRVLWAWMKKTLKDDVNGNPKAA